MKTAWVVDFDQAGKRRLKTVTKKKDADAFNATAAVEIRAGTHTADSASPTVAEAARLWLASCRSLERTTVDAYEQYVRLHISPFLGRMKMSQLTAPLVRECEDRLRRGQPMPGEETGKPRSPAMLKRIIESLGFMLADAQERGLIARNVVRDLRSNRKKDKERRAERRQEGKLKIGVDIPTREEIKAIVEARHGNCAPC